MSKQTTEPAKAAAPAAPVAPAVKVSRPPRKWKLVVAGVSVVLLGLLAIAGIQYFPRWNEQRILHRARNSITLKAYVPAALYAQRVLQMNARNADAVRIMTQIADATHSKDTLYWYHRLASLEPQRPDTQLNYIERALEFGKLAVANQMLNAVDDATRKTARYHELAGRSAAVTHQTERAESELAEATRLEPANGTYAFEWAAACIDLPESARHSEALQVVTDRLSQPEFFSRASRALIDEAVKRHDGSKALSLAKALAQAPTASLSDEIVYLQLLHDLKRPEFGVFLMDLQDKVVASADDTAKLLTWLLNNHGALTAKDWIKRLPGELTTKMPVPVAIANVYVDLQNWDDLKPLVLDSPANGEDSGKDGKGGKNPPADGSAPEEAKSWAGYEFMRLALACRTLKGQGETEAARVKWNTAVQAAASRPEALAILARAAVDWNWDKESDELLWMIGRGSNEPRWALSILYNRYYAAKATLNLFAVAKRMFELDPNDPLAQDSFAMLSFVLESNVEQGFAVAEGLYKKDPTNLSYASTYAYGLHLEGRTKESIQIMRAVGPAGQSEPGFMAYYFVFLVAEGEFREAETVNGRLQLSVLFPEEVELVTKARSQLAAQSRP